MAKITLGKPPKTFAPVTVSFPMPDGSKGEIECVFKYRTRKEFGQFLADTFNTGKTPEGSEQRTVAEIMATAVQTNGAYLAKVLHSWNLDEPLNEANAAQLADEVPAASSAIMEAYGRAVTEGHLGN